MKTPQADWDPFSAYGDSICEDEPAPAGLLVLIGSAPGVCISLKQQFAERSRVLSNAERRSLGKSEQPREVIRLASRASERCEITELEPYDGTFIGKRIEFDGSITQYPRVKWWRQSVAVIPATVPGLFAYLRDARTRNICLIRGKPANIERKRTQRWVAGVGERGEHGFLDRPSKLLFIDVDGFKTAWRGDPEGAVLKLLAALGEPWSVTSCVWFLSGTHGLERDKEKRWTGEVSDDNVRVRLAFILDRELNANEATALTRIAKAKVPQVDGSLSHTVQPNYITRPHWVAHPNLDVLGEIPTIGRITGTREFLAVPSELSHKARWARAEGRSVEIADHPDAETAVRSIGSDGRVRTHLMNAAEHLLIDNPAPEGVNLADHAIAVAGALWKVVDQHQAQVTGNLAAHGRGWGDVLRYFPDEMVRWVEWMQAHPSYLARKTISLSPVALPETTRSSEDTFARVARTIEHARTAEGPSNPWVAWAGDEPPVELLVAPTGSRKSTLMRAAAVLSVREHPGYKVVCLVPRHELGNEQLKHLAQEHPDGDFRAAIWISRHGKDPELPGKQMCWRPEEAEELEKNMLDVEHHLCAQGRGKNKIKCPFHSLCGFQRQKAVVAEADIIFAAHEVAAYKKPEIFGDITLLMFDESPIDAFLFDQQTLALDELKSAALPVVKKLKGLLIINDDEENAPPNLDVAVGREHLYQLLDRIGPASGLSEIKQQAHWLWKLEMGGKVIPKIRPNMTPAQVRKELEKAAGNKTVMKLAMLWQLVEESKAEPSGRIQVYHKRDKGRHIRMVGLMPLAEGWNVRTLICDATGDADLLRAIWPYLETDETVKGWEQLPKPASVRYVQCVDRSFSKWSIAIESNIKFEHLKDPKKKEEARKRREQDLTRRKDNARRVYGSMLVQALQYCGAEVEGEVVVGCITYKSTREWIEQNCFVPSWLKFSHWGAATGTNDFAHARALFVIGRPLADAEDVVQQAEALFEEYIPERGYRVWRKHGQIPIVPDAAGNHTIQVDERRLQNANAERLHQQITRAAVLQIVGRIRAGLRGSDEPADLHIWNDVPVPELGPVEPVLWDEVDGGLDGLMLAAGGVWLERVSHAAAAYSQLFTVDGLKTARKGSVGVSLIVNSYKRNTHTSPQRFAYRQKGQGKRLTRGTAICEPASIRSWLEERLGPLADFKLEGGE